MRYRPEEEQNRKRTQQPRHGVDHDGYLSDIGRKVGKKTSRKHEDRVTRRVTHLQLVGLDDKLATVPVRGRGFERKPISDKGDCKHNPSPDIIDEVILFSDHNPKNELSSI